MLVKVVNDNKYPYSEKFKGKQIDIPPGKSVEMTEEEAIMFLGTFAGVRTDADGAPDPRGFKMLRIEKPTEKKAKDV